MCRGSTGRGVRGTAVSPSGISLPGGCGLAGPGRSLAWSRPRSGSWALGAFALDLIESRALLRGQDRIDAAAGLADERPDPGVELVHERLRLLALVGEDALDLGLLFGRQVEVPGELIGVSRPWPGSPHPAALGAGACPGRLHGIGGPF